MNKDADGVLGLISVTMTLVMFVGVMAVVMGAI